MSGVWSVEGYLEGYGTYYGEKYAQLDPTASNNNMFTAHNNYEIKYIGRSDNVLVQLKHRSQPLG